MNPTSTPAYLMTALAQQLPADEVTAAFTARLENAFNRAVEAQRRRVQDFGDLPPDAAEQEPAQFFAVYDNTTAEIGRVYERQRDAETCCTEWNAYAMTERYVVEPVPAVEWAESDVRSA